MRRKIVLFIIIAICFLLQTTVFRALTFANIGPNLLIIVVSSFGLMRGSRVVVLSYASLVMMVLRFVVQYYRVGLRSFRGSIQRTVYPAALMASLTSPMVTLP